MLALAVGGLLLATSTAMARLWPTGVDYVQGLLGGMTVAGLAALVGLGVLLQAARVFQPIDGDDPTHVELLAATEEGLIHGFARRVCHDGHELGPLVVAGCGVVAVATVAHRRQPTELERRRDLASARDVGFRTRSLLQSLGHDGVPVLVVVVAWGVERHALNDEGTAVDGIPVVPGGGLRSWLASRGADDAVDRHLGLRLAQGLDAHAAAQVRSAA